VLLGRSCPSRNADPAPLQTATWHIVWVAARHCNMTVVRCLCDEPQAAQRFAAAHTASRRPRACAITACSGAPSHSAARHRGATTQGAPSRRQRHTTTTDTLEACTAPPRQQQRTRSNAAAFAFYSSQKKAAAWFRGHWVQQQTAECGVGPPPLGAVPLPLPGCPCSSGGLARRETPGPLRCVGQHFLADCASSPRGGEQRRAALLGAALLGAAPLAAAGRRERNRERKAK
jgi:hypothetical protein